MNIIVFWTVNCISTDVIFNKKYLTIFRIAKNLSYKLIWWMHNKYEMIFNDKTTYCKGTWFYSCFDIYQIIITLCGLRWLIINNIILCYVGLEHVVHTTQFNCLITYQWLVKCSLYGRRDKNFLGFVKTTSLCRTGRLKWWVQWALRFKARVQFQS